MEDAYTKDKAEVLRSLKGDEKVDESELEYRYQKWRTFYLMCAAAFDIHKGQEFLVMYYTMRPNGA